MTMHTLGPWWLDERTKWVWVMDENGGFVAEMRKGEPEVPVVLAAPEMLDALKKIAYEAGQYADGADDAHYLSKVCLELESIARAAIAKAEGEE